MELAREVLGGKYEFVLTTHIDKDHVHNHLIFNAVSFADHKHYHSNKRSYHYIRRTSDRLCKEQGLSVIVPGQDRGKSYIEQQAALKAELQKAQREEQDYAAMRRNVEGFLSTPQQEQERKKNVELE